MKKDVKELEVVSKEVVVEKKQKISVSYTLKSFANNANKLKEAKMITEEEYTKLALLHENMVKTWIGISMSM